MTIGGKTLEMGRMLSWPKGSSCPSSKLPDLYHTGIRKLARFICSVTLEAEAQVSFVHIESNRISFLHHIVVVGVFWNVYIMHNDLLKCKFRNQCVCRGKHLSRKRSLSRPSLMDIDT